MVETTSYHLLNALELSQDIQRVCDKRFGSGQIELTELLRARSGGVVFSAHFRGQNAIVKKIQKSGASALVRQIETTLSRFDQALGHGPYRVSRCLATLPGQGLIITEFIEGPTLREELQSASAERRELLLTRLGGWLEQAATMGAEGAEKTAFSPDWTISQLADLPYDTYAPEERAILQSLLRALTRFGSMHRGAEMRLSIGHDDCHAQNFIWTDTAIWAIDIEECRLQPTAKMIGNFLGWYAMHSPCVPSPLASAPSFGAEPGDLAALCAAVPLRPGETKITLPFFLITRQIECLFPAPKTPARRQENIARAQVLLHDLCMLMDH